MPKGRPPGAKNKVKNKDYIKVKFSDLIIEFPKIFRDDAEILIHPCYRHFFEGKIIIGTDEGAEEENEPSDTDTKIEFEVH